MTRSAFLSLLAWGAVSTAVYAQAPAPQPLPALPTPSQPVVPAKDAAAAPTTPAGAPAAPAASPIIQFQTQVYDFGRVKSGDPVKYTYIFTNTAPEGCGAVLEVSHVQPSCGCTTAGEWTKKVEPGKTGTIPIQFNSANYGGQVVKQITVTCNDPTHPNVVLQLKGTIWKPVELNPPYSGITLPPDATSGSTSVRILCNLEAPIHLSPPESNNRKITAVLTTNQPDKDFQLVLSTVPPLDPGTFTAEVSLKTDSTDVPVIKVPVWVNVQPLVNLTPPSPSPVVVPPGPLANKTAQSIRIQNNSTNSMKVYDAAIDMPGIDIQMKELVPGKIFDVQLIIPEGFLLEPGKQLAFTAKSSLDKYPLIKVPVIQAPHPPGVKVAAPPLPGTQIPAPLPQGNMIKRPVVLPTQPNVLPAPSTPPPPTPPSTTPTASAAH
jgi:hypothetical protein